MSKQTKRMKENEDRPTIDMRNENLEKIEAMIDRNVKELYVRNENTALPSMGGNLNVS